MITKRDGVLIIYIILWLSIILYELGTFPLLKDYLYPEWLGFMMRIIRGIFRELLSSTIRHWFTLIAIHLLPVLIYRRGRANKRSTGSYYLRKYADEAKSEVN